MMTTRFSSKIPSAILIGSVLMLSACASLKTGDTINPGGTIANKTDEATRATIEKGKLETPQVMTGEPQSPSVTKVVDQVKTAPEVVPDAAQTSKATVTKINHREPSVNVRTSPSAKSRVVAVLKKGQTIEVLEEKDSWLKVSWHKGNAVKQGWLKRMFVEGYEQQQ